MEHRRSNTLRVTVVSLIVLLTGGAFAPADAIPLTTIFCGMTVMDPIKVANNLSNCVLDGLIIGDDDVVIDLNGRTIDGNGTDNAMNVGEHGIENSAGHAGLVVKRGVIKEFEGGVRSGVGAHDNTFERLAIAGNTFQGISVSGERLVVRRSVVSGNGGTGINFGSDDLVFERNIVSGNGDSGIGGTGDRGVYKRNAVSGNRGPGINVGGSDTEFVKNVVSGNSSSGIFTIGVNPHITGNTASGNGFDPPGTDDLSGRGIDAGGATNPTGGNNVAVANDLADCNPVFLCA